MPRPDRHNEIELNLVSSGSITYLLGGRRTEVTAGTLAMFWAAIPHQIMDFEGASPYMVLTVPLGEFLTSELDVSLVNRVLGGELVTSAATEMDGLSFHRWEQDLRSNSATLEESARLESRARLLRFAHEVSSQQVTQAAASLSRADRIASYIARNYQQALTSEVIAEAAGVHANYAMGLFRKTFGTTMTSFITQHRISHAQRLLVTTDMPILEIALDSGFQSLSRFNEAFRAACNCPPRDYRKQHTQIAESR